MITGSPIVAFVGVAFTALTLHADIFVDLGASTQNFILTGQGQVPGPFGTWGIQQGSCGPLTGTVTCTLSGSIVAGGSPGFTSGTYSFVTTFLATDLDPVQGISASVDPGPLANYFHYDYLAPSVSMVLDMHTPGGDYSVPLFTGGVFDGGFSFAYTGTETCTGVATCDQAHVGLVNGATISGPVTMSIDIPGTPTAVPEPSSVILLFTLVLGVALMARKSWAERSATRTCR